MASFSDGKTQTDELGETYLNFEQFQTLTFYFLELKKNFDIYDKDNSQSISKYISISSIINIHRPELNPLLNSLKLDITESSKNFLFSIFDKSKFLVKYPTYLIGSDGSICFDEFATMMLYLRSLQQKFADLEKSNSEISASELQAILRAHSLPITSLEAEIFLEE